MNEATVAPGVKVESARKLRTHCLRGHEFTVENTVRVRGAIRTCRICDRHRKDRYIQKERATREWKVEVVCPCCRRIRKVVWTHARRLQHKPRPCHSCSRRIVRGTMVFATATCEKCGREFSRRSGSARRCDDCAQRKPPERKECPVCGAVFVGYQQKGTCSNACRRRWKLNSTYFGGRLFDARGWAEKECQLCGRHVPRKAHVHHVFKHPKQDALVVLCAGCHDVVSTLANRNTYKDEQFRRLKWFVNAQRSGKAPAGEDPESWQGYLE